MEKYSCVEEKTFDDARTFINYLRLSNGNWGNGLETPWIFRGQGNAVWPLIPKAWRNGTRTQEFADLIRRIKIHAQIGADRIIKEEKKGDVLRLGTDLQSSLLSLLRLDNAEIAKERVTSLLVQVAVESEAIREFLILGDELGWLSSW